MYPEWLQSNGLAVVGYTLLFLCVYYLFQTVSNRWGLPPGPLGYPIVGYLPFLNKQDLPASFKELSEQYGDIFCFRLGQRLTIILSSWDLIKEALVKKSEIFSGRPPYSIIGFFYDNNNILCTDGEMYNIQKRFLLSSLKDFGFGKLSIEPKIHQEAQAMMSFLHEKQNQPINLSILFNFVTTNVICSLAFGQRYEYGDPRIKKLLQYLGDILVIMDQVSLIEAYPFLRFLPDKWNGLHRMKEMKRSLQDFMDEMIDEHIETFDAKNPRDLIDYYLQKMEENGMNTKDHNSRELFSRFNVSQNLILVFFAGTETSATILAWAMKLLLSHPDVQEMVQKEIDSVLGRSQLSSWTDRNLLPYTEATLHEVHRVAAIAPLNVAHSNTEEAYIDGYKIPKRSCIITNLWQVHNDPKLWKNPEKFDPTRFLDENGKVFKPEYLIPFSVGKRYCLGEPFAKMEIFIFFVSLLQNFTFRCVGEVPDCSQVVFGLVRKPAPFEVYAEPR